MYRELLRVRPSEGMTYDVDSKPPSQLGRRGGAAAGECEAAFSSRSGRLRRVWGVVRAQQVKGAGRHVAVYLDGQINLEVGVELETPWAGMGRVGSALPAGTRDGRDFGPYNGLARRIRRSGLVRDPRPLAGGPTGRSTALGGRVEQRPGQHSHDVCCLLTAASNR